MLVKGEGFVGEELPGREGAMYVIREKGTGTPVLAMSDMKSYYEGPDGVTRPGGRHSLPHHQDPRKHPGFV